MEPGTSMHSGERHGRHGGLLYALLLITAVAVIIFSVIGIATMAGVLPGVPLPSEGVVRKHEPAGDGAARSTRPVGQEPASNDASPRSANRADVQHACSSCGASKATEVARSGG